MSIRAAHVSDAEAIAAVHVASWQAAYRGQLPDDVLDGLDVGRRTVGWRRVLANVGTTLVAEGGNGRVAGFVQAVPSRDGDAGPATAEVTMIYAEPGSWSTGVGRELMAAAVTAMAGSGFTEATLWVLATNDRARRFYERAGWLPDGTTKEDVVAGVPVTEVRYRRAL